MTVISHDYLISILVRFSRIFIHSGWKHSENIGNTKKKKMLRERRSSQAALHLLKWRLANKKNMLREIDAKCHLATRPIYRIKVGYMVPEQVKIKKKGQEEKYTHTFRHR